MAVGIMADWRGGAQRGGLQPAALLGISMASASSLLDWFVRVLYHPRLRRGLSLALTAVVALLVVWALHHALAEVDAAQVLQLMGQVPAQALGYAALAAAASYLVMTGYDFSALKYLAPAQPPPRTAVLVTSFMAYTLGNTVGLGVLAGGAVRMRMFTQWGLTALQVTRLIAFNALAFGAGITVLGALALLVGAQRAAQHTQLPVAAIVALAALVLAAALAFLWCCARLQTLRLGPWQLQLPSLGLALRQLLITATDTVLAGLALWFLLPPSPLTWWAFLMVYMLALTAGILSHVPGGLGVFEAVMFTGLSASGLPATALAAALVLYRVVYYLLPLVAAALLLTGYALWMRLNSRPGRARRRLHVTGMQIARNIAWAAPLVLGGLAFAAGAVLLAAGARPDNQAAALALQRWHVPQFWIEASRLLGSVCGLLLLVLARALLERLDAAWWLALLATGLALWLSLPNGFAWYEMAMLAVLLGLLLVSKEQFSSHSSLFAVRLELGWLLALGLVFAALGWIIYFAYSHEDLSHMPWWRFALDARLPPVFRAAMLAAVLALLLGAWQLLRRRERRPH
ncbi:lysylphosphatidylglycerol synthase domain-containing protein [Vandammella animalimorsus]|uniref:lysylphosphatidylglycerol synthase domain-containing protein n=1 Tax=Vandammella animalimorsus TaxID=2029117 RepID=UPI0031BA7A71